MTPPPIPMVWNGAHFTPLPKFASLAVDSYGAGEIVSLAPVDKRSGKSHDHFFAAMQEMWATLPESTGDRYPTVEAFRKSALIATGHCDTDTTVCSSNAEALRLRAVVQHVAPESLAVMRNNVVTIYTAHSQSMKAMGAKVFQKSKDDCLNWAAQQLGLDGFNAARDREAVKSPSRQAA